MGFFANLEERNFLRKQNEALEKQLDEVRKEKRRLADENTAYKERSESQVKKIAELSKRVREAEEGIREQTTADLLLVSTRIIEKIKKGEKPTKVEIEEQAGLQALAAQQAQAMRNAPAQTAWNNYGLGALGAIGIGALGNLVK